MRIKKTIKLLLVHLKDKLTLYITETYDANPEIKFNI